MIKSQLRSEWAVLEEIPETSPAQNSSSGLRPRQVPGTTIHNIGGSEFDKHAQCSRALWSLCHGKTIKEAAAHSGLTEQQVTAIYQAYGIQNLVTNEKHQVDDNMQIGPWTNSRLHQSGYERYKNDFHSWHFCWACKLSVDEALDALKTWPELRAIKARLIRDYPQTWLEFARMDIARCYEKFARFLKPAMVRKRTMLRVERTVAGLNKRIFTTQDLLPLLNLSKRQIQRALAQMPSLRRIGSKRGSKWEVLLTSENSSPNPSSNPVPPSHSPH